MEKKIKSLQACVVILAIALCACVYKISALDSRIEQLDYLLDRQYDRIMTDVNEIYQNVDEKLREEASLLSGMEAEYGEINLEDHTIDVTVKLLPKLISDDMTIQVSINGRNTELSRTGNNFTGTIPVDLYNMGEQMLMTIDTAAGTQTQYLSEIQVEYLWGNRIPSLYYSDISGQLCSEIPCSRHQSLTDNPLSFRCRSIPLHSCNWYSCFTSLIFTDNTPLAFP